MASISVPSVSAGTVVGVGVVGAPYGPAHLAVQCGTGKRVVHDLVGLAVADVMGFALNDAATYTDNGTTITVTKP